MTSPPSKDQLNQARQAAINAYAEADRLFLAYLRMIERSRHDVDQKTSFLMRETMQQKPGRRIEQ